MPLSTDAIPNSPLTGSELMEYVIKLINEHAPRYAGVPFKVDLQFTMQNPAVPRYEVRTAIAQGSDVACPVCNGRPPADPDGLCETCCGEYKVPNTRELALANLCAEVRKRMSSDWVFGVNLTYPNIKFTIVLSLIVGPDRSLSQRELSVHVANPNLVRVHYDLPIRQSEKILPTEEMPFGGLRWGVVEFSKADYPAPAPPIEKNLTPEIAGDLGDDPNDEDKEDDEEDAAADEIETADAIVAQPPVEEHARVPRQRGKKK